MQPSWEKEEQANEAEYQELLHERVEQERQQISDDYLFKGDVLGLDDGRPGLEGSPATFILGNLLWWGESPGYIAVGAIGLIVALLIFAIGLLWKIAHHEAQSISPTAQTVQQDQ